MRFSTHVFVILFSLVCPILMLSDSEKFLFIRALVWLLPDLNQKPIRGFELFVRLNYFRKDHEKTLLGILLNPFDAFQRHFASTNISGERTRPNFSLCIHLAIKQ